MSEQARARALAGSMSLLSAGIVAAMLLGAAVVASHLVRPLANGTGQGVVRLFTPASAGSAPTTAAARPTVHRAIHHAGARPHRLSTSSVAPTSRTGDETGGSGGGSGTGGGEGGSGSSASVDAGPVHASAEGGSSGAGVSVDAGPVHVSAKVDPQPVDDALDTTKKTVCQLTC